MTRSATTARRANVTRCWLGGRESIAAILRDEDHGTDSEGNLVIMWGLLARR